MPCSNTAALAAYERQQDAADDRAEAAEEYRDQAVEELTDEVMRGDADAVCTMSEALCEGPAGTDDVGNALDCLAVLTKFVLKGEGALRTKDEDRALATVRTYVRDYISDWSDKVEDRMYKLAGFEV